MIDLAGISTDLGLPMICTKGQFHYLDVISPV